MNAENQESPPIKKNMTKEHHDVIKKLENLEEKYSSLEKRYNEVNNFNNFLQTKLLQERGNSLNWEYQHNLVKNELDGLKAEKETPKKQGE